MVAEVALAVVLLVGAGLLGRSLDRLLQVDTGVRAEHVLTMRVMMAGTQYTDDPALRNFMGALLPRLGTLPGATAAGAVAYLPLTGQKIGHSFYINDRPRPRPGEEYSTDIRPIAGDYFRALGVPLLRGRFFDARDNERGGPVFIVNDALAREYFGGTIPSADASASSGGRQSPARSSASSAACARWARPRRRPRPSTGRTRRCPSRR